MFHSLMKGRLKPACKEINVIILMEKSKQFELLGLFRSAQFRILGNFMAGELKAMEIYKNE